LPAGRPEAIAIDASSAGLRQYRPVLSPCPVCQPSLPPPSKEIGMRALYVLFLVAFAGAVGAFAYYNRQEVSLRFLDWSMSASLAAVAGVAYLLGMLTGGPSSACFAAPWSASPTVAVTGGRPEGRRAVLAQSFCKSAGS
jgi:hypothetical protein